jgi:hypothetical protein
MILKFIDLRRQMMFKLSTSTQYQSHVSDGVTSECREHCRADEARDRQWQQFMSYGWRAV